jgi:uncharacterized protein
LISATNARETVVRLADGDDLVESLRGLSITSAVIAGGIGMVRAVRLGYWNGHAYEETRIDDPAELLSMQGTIASSVDGPAVHCHVTLVGRDGLARGGHLLGATVTNTAEIALLLVPGIRLERRPEGAGLANKLFPSAERSAGT